jgi:membrane protein required for colicin V production
MLALRLGQSLNWVDLVSLLVLAAFFVYGVVRGFMLQLASIVVLVLAVVAASLTSARLGHWLTRQFPALTQTAAKYVCFAIVLLVCVAVGVALAHLLRGVLEKAKLLAYDRILGGILGVLKGALLLIVMMQLYLNLVIPEGERPQGMAADIVRSKAGVAAKWSSEKLLVFLPHDIGEKLRDYDKLN